MFLLLAFGMVTNYALDVLLISVTRRVMFAHPLSWEAWQLDLVRPDNWLGTMILVACTAFVWLVVKVWNRAEQPLTDEIAGDA